MKGMGETAEYAIGKVQKPVVETAKKMAKPLGEPQPETLGEKVTGVAAGLPFEIAKRPAKWLQTFYHWEERSEAWEKMIKNPIGSEESKEGAREFIAKNKWMQQRGLTPESLPIEWVLDLFYAARLYQGMYNRAYVKDLIKKFYITKKISPKELSEIVAKQRKKFLGNQYPTEENLEKATGKAWQHIDKTFKKHGIGYKERLLGGIELIKRKPTITITPVFETAQNLIAPTISKGVVVKGVKPIVPTMPKFITGKNVWEIPAPTFAAQTRLAVKDLKTGKIYLGNKDETIHSQILLRMDEMDIPYGSEIEAGFVSPDKSWIPRWKGIRRGPNEVEPIGIAEFEHADLHKYTIKKALDAGKTPYKGWEKDYPELAKKPPAEKDVAMELLKKHKKPELELKAKEVKIEKP
ncbi:hypothetical protein KA005_79005, partial [bacterium]|nr:hypothetical protein [bacterium]